MLAHRKRLSRLVDEEWRGKGDGANEHPQPATKNDERSKQKGSKIFRQQPPPPHKPRAMTPRSNNFRVFFAASPRRFCSPHSQATVSQQSSFGRCWGRFLLPCASPLRNVEHVKDAGVHHVTCSPIHVSRRDHGLTMDGNGESRTHRHCQFGMY